MFYVHVFKAYESGAVSPFQAFAAFIPFEVFEAPAFEALRPHPLKPSFSHLEAFVPPFEAFEAFILTLRCLRSPHPAPSKPPSSSLPSLSSSPFVRSLEAFLPSARLPSTLHFRSFEGFEPPFTEWSREAPGLSGLLRLLTEICPNVGLNNVCVSPSSRTL